MMTAEYEKFYACQPLTRRELKKLDLIDRIRYLIKRQPKEKWTPKDIREALMAYGLICDHITIHNIEDEMRSYYG